jgi:hypothetical protein
MTENDLFFFHFILFSLGFIFIANALFPFKELFTDRSEELKESDKLAKENMKLAELHWNAGSTDYFYHQAAASFYQRKRIEDNHNKISGNLVYSFPALFLWGVPLLTLAEKATNKDIGLFIMILFSISFSTTVYFYMNKHPFLQIINTMVGALVCYGWFKGVIYVS